MIRKVILCLCFSLMLSGCSSWENKTVTNDGRITLYGMVNKTESANFVSNSKYEMILWGGPVTYSYYVDDYTIVGNFIVVNRYVEDERFGDSSIIRENRLMLPSGITIIKDRK